MILLKVLIVGLVATATGDAWHLGLRVFAGLPTGKWGTAGRWIAGFAQGRFVDAGIATRPPVPNEEALGWAFHYFIGISYAALYLGLLELGTAREPTFGNALLFGVVTVVAPFCIMKPALGGGFMGLKAPHPMRGILLSLSTHAVFGLGLYLGCILFEAID